jgi:predicted MFS family arabinose efflux permease
MSINTAAMGGRATGISVGLTFLLATGCGLSAANLYYSQPLAGPIGTALGLSPAATGLIVTFTQIGYGLGLLLLVPLADIIENRRLLVATIMLACLGLVGAATSANYVAFLASSLVIGLGSVTAQIIVPYASYMAPEATRGRVVGNVLSGLLLGIMLARPVSSFLAEFFSWHVVFALSAIAMAGLAITLRSILPPRHPPSGMSYPRLLASMARLVATTPILRRRGLYQACLFGCFSLFWTTVPLLLAGPVFHLGQLGIGIFALVGVSGAIASPIAGRVADRGLIRPATIIAILMTAVAIFGTRFTLSGSTASLVLLTVAAILIDFGVAASLTLGQRAIFTLPAELRGRLNGLYIAALFIGGAIGSAVGGWAFASGGWLLASAIGTAFPTIAFLYALTDWPKRRVATAQA